MILDKLNRYLAIEKNVCVAVKPTTNLAPQLSYTFQITTVKSYLDLDSLM